MRHFLFATATLALLLGTIHPVAAKPWIVDYSQSHLGFIGTESGKPFTGSFKNFQANIDLDPAHPETGTITTTIDIASATAGSSERDSYLPQGDWFNTKAFPQAQFTSTSITKTGDGTYLAQGNLTIKGISHPVSLPFTLKSESDHWRAEGKVTLTRTDFNIGQGDWSNEDYVKRAVDVVINISAKPAS